METRSARPATAIIDRYLILVFIALLSLPLIMTRPDADPGTENRILGQLEGSQAAEEGIASLPARVEGFINDHFGFRPQMVRLYHRILVMFRDTSQKNVIIGRDGWLYYSEDDLLGDITGQQLFSAGELAVWRRYIGIKARALKDIGIPYVFVTVPNKHMIYPRYLPSRYRPADDMTRTDQWLDAITGSGDLPVIDLRKSFREAAFREPLYLPADTHWTHAGASIARSLILEEFRRQGLDLGAEPADSGRLTVKTLMNGDLAGMLNLQDHYPMNVPVKRSPRNPAQQMATRYNTMFARQETPTLRMGKRFKLLIIGDSTLFALSDLMREDVAETLNVRLHDHQLRHLDPLVHYITTFQPDAVIEVRIGRMLLDTTPENPPQANLDGYPPWMKKYFSVVELKEPMPIPMPEPVVMPGSAGG